CLIYLLSFIGTEYLWYDQINRIDTFWTSYKYPILTFFISLPVTFLFALSILLTNFNKRSSSNKATNKLSKNPSFSKFSKPVVVLVSLTIGFMISLNLAGNWKTIMLYLNQTSFGQTDAIFGKDISFYTFTLPFIKLIRSSLTVESVMLLIGVIAIGLFFGGIRYTKISNQHSIIEKTPMNSMIFLVTLFIVFQAAETYLSRFALLLKNGERITGGEWTDINIVSPSYLIMTVYLIVFAVLFIIIANATKKNNLDIVNKKVTVNPVTFLIGGEIIYAVISFLAVGLIPIIVQRLYVNPNAQSLEKPYIQYNIDATRQAWGLDDVKMTSYNVTEGTSADALKQDAETANQIRLLDPQIVSPTFKQIQQTKQYYNFADTLSVDKYTFDDNGAKKTFDTLIAAREINLSGNDQRNWTNDHTVYTHGFGVVAAYGNAIESDGKPKFYEKDIPTTGLLTTEENYEPRIYFSPNAPDYSIVGQKSDDGENASWEFDYPTDQAGGATTTYEGNGGPKISNPLIRLMYAILFKSDQIFFSERVTTDSQILYDRDPAERVEKAAPYLITDGRVYPAVVDGRVKYIIDCYTSSASYPYSKQVDLGAETTDTITSSSSSVESLDSKKSSYLKNSVKAVVDAYDGSVTLYKWQDDPILDTYSKIYNTKLAGLDEVSGDLMSHFRYPEDLFKVQRSLLAKYHVTDPSQFFSGEDFWAVALNPTSDATATSSNSSSSSTSTKASNSKNQPPYYLTLKTKEMENAVFSLTSSFIPGGSSTREILTGFLSVDSDAGNEAGVVGKNYGTIRLLELPKNSTVPGPGQAQNNFNANATVSTQLNLLQSGSTTVMRGNLLTLPLAGGLVYIQPVYVKSSSNTSFPLLKKVLVSFGDKVGFADTLDDALNQVFGGGADTASNATASTDKASDSSSATNPDDSTDSTGATDSSDSTGSNSSSSNSATNEDKIAKLKELSSSADTALRSGDLATYAAIQNQIKDLINSL
ncbi:MAG: UPF0182 family protein, partial [Bifidobacteriaceae bacterium]|nr:UPF0182 family protein [Bifidobacteriaceae bacterium]